MVKKTELEKAISAIKFKDDNGDKYVFDVTANRRIGNGMESADLLLKKSGADTLKRAAEFAKENEFESLHITVYKNKTGREKGAEYDVPLFEETQLAGVDTPAIQQPTQDEADRYFQSFGGLGGFMQETRNQIGNQLDLQYARRDLGKAEAQVVALESKNEQLAAKNDELREQIKEYKDRIHDLERDMGYQKQNYDQRSNMLQLVTNGVVGFIGSQLGVTPEKLGQLMGIPADGTETTQQTPTEPAKQESVSGTKDERQQYIDAIVEYIYTLNAQEIQLFAGITQYVGQSQRHLAKTYEYLRNLFNKEKNGNQEDNNDTD